MGPYKQWLVFVLFPLLFSCSGLKLIDKPITYDEKREQLSLEYLEKRYGIHLDKAGITPKIIVLHWTVTPTMEKTFQAFDPPMLPESRAAIKSASNLNVSSHFLVDRDGKVYKLLPETHFARHVIGLNHCAIGIENVGGTDALPLTKAQTRANIKLVKYLAGKYNIEYLIGHYEYKEFIGHELWKELDASYLTEKDDPGESFMNAVRKKTVDLNLKGPPTKL
jgi:N-acetyl-anhydromuramyl-L-alanine amidase AmpD